MTLSSGRWRGAVLVLLLVPADVLLLGGDGVRVNPHEVRHVTQHVDLILNVDAGFVLLVCGKFLIVLFLYDLQTGAVPPPRPSCLVMLSSGNLMTEPPPPPAPCSCCIWWRREEEFCTNELSDDS